MRKLCSRRSAGKRPLPRSDTGASFKWERSRSSLMRACVRTTRLLLALALLAPGAAAHVATYDGHAWVDERPLRFELEAGERLEAGREAQARVLPAWEGAPQVNGARLEAVHEDGEGRLEATLRADGPSFIGAITFPQPGLWHVRAVLDPQSAGSAVYEVQVEPPQPWRVRLVEPAAGVLVEGGTISMRIEDAAGNPAPPGEAEAVSLSNEVPIPLEVRARDGGAYEIDIAALRPGEHEVLLTAAHIGLFNATSQPVRILVVAEDEAHVYLADEAGARETPATTSALLLLAGLAACAIATRRRS